MMSQNPKPWCVCRLGVGASERVVRRYAKREDAEKDVQQAVNFDVLGQYVVAYDVDENS